MLTNKQLNVVRCISDGLNINQTADKLNISRSTVEKVLVVVKRKLNAKTLAHVASIAIRNGLICVLITMSVTSSVNIVRLRNRNGRREWTT